MLMFIKMIKEFYFKYKYFDTKILEISKNSIWQVSANTDIQLKSSNFALLFKYGIVFAFGVFLYYVFL